MLWSGGGVDFVEIDGRQNLNGRDIPLMPFHCLQWLNTKYQVIPWGKTRTGRVPRDHWPFFLKQHATHGRYNATNATIVFEGSHTILRFLRYFSASHPKTSLSPHSTATLQQMSTHARNPGYPLDMGWVNSVRINMPAINRRAAEHMKRRSVKKKYQAAWLLRAVSVIDLTTLSGSDTAGNVERLCFKAKTPIRQDLVESLDIADLNLTTGAICVYPERVPDAVAALERIGASHIPIASVATGFPAGQTPLKDRISEIKQAVEYGASEIDMVIPRATVLTGDWQALYDDVKACREACGEAHLKCILATGDLGTLTNVYKASVVAMLAGSDFIKTSTGKEGVNATFPVAFTMIRAIREFYEKTGTKIGFKPAGGVRSAKDTLSWLAMMKDELGDDWTKPDLFRIGASSLLSDIERQLYHYCSGKYAAGHQFASS